MDATRHDAPADAPAHASRQHAAPATGIPVDRGATRTPAPSSSPSPSSGPDAAVPVDPAVELVDQIQPQVPLEDSPAKKGASPVTVRAALLSAATVFGLAAAIHVVRYVLLLINRTTLLPPLVAGAALWLGVLLSLAVIVSVVMTAVVLTSWLVGRRSAVFRFRGHDDPRPAWALWVGCLAPVLNLLWAPVFLIELAHAEESQARLRGPITAWWIAWVFSTGISIFAIATSFTTEPQGIADNTVAVIIAYLVGLATVLLLWRVFDAFVRKPVERPLHRWVIVAEDQPAGEPAPAALADGEPRGGRFRGCG